MFKYFQLLKLSWQNEFVYRVSLLMWRFRRFLSVFIGISVWKAIIETQGNAFGYLQGEMIAYLMLTGFLGDLVLSTSLMGLANQIYSGEISQLLIKPMNLFGYFITKELADTLKNVIFSVFEMSILWVIFQPTFPSISLESFILFFFSLILSIILLFFIQLLFGAIGFWSPETWAPRFLFFMILEFTSGQLFPLDILPSTLQKMLYVTPFPYFTFAQTQIVLGRFSFKQSGYTFFALSFWIILLFFVVQKVWRKGIKDYSAVGG